MLRTGLLALQISLALACGALVWRMAAPLWRAGPPRAIELKVPEPPPRATPALARYEAIVARNLFSSSAIGAAASVPRPVEKVAASRLQVRLLGTAATQPPELGVAALEDSSTRERVSLRVGDRVAGAIIRRIERGRVVVENAGHLEEIVFDTDDATHSAPRGARASGRGAARSGSAARSRATPRSRAARISERVKQLTERFRRSAAARGAPGTARGSAAVALPAAPAGSALGAPEGSAGSASKGKAPSTPKLPFFQQAQTTPEWSPQGGMLGLRVRDVRSGTRVARAGVARGDLITEVNGTPLEQVAQSYGAIRSAIESGKATLRVQREGKTLDIVVGQE
ncbi:MAG: type II secretion system protein N [Myxococcota bacterium]